MGNTNIVHKIGTKIEDRSCILDIDWPAGKVFKLVVICCTSLQIALLVIRLIIPLPLPLPQPPPSPFLTSWILSLFCLSIQSTIILGNWESYIKAKHVNDMVAYQCTLAMCHHHLTDNQSIIFLFKLYIIHYFSI